MYKYESNKPSNEQSEKKKNLSLCQVIFPEGFPERIVKITNQLA